MTLTQEQIAHVRSLEDAEGRLTPDVVVADAKRKDSPIHSLFEWDKTKAAAILWIQQAREVIASVTIVRQHETTIVNSVVYVRDPDATGQGYRSVMALRSEPDRAREALIIALKTATGHLRRCYDMAEEIGLSSDIDGLVEQIVGLQRRLESAAA